MTLKALKLVAVIMSLVGIGLFIVCRIFEPTIVKGVDKKQ